MPGFILYTDVEVSMLILISFIDALGNNLYETEREHTVILKSLLQILLQSAYRALKPLWNTALLKEKITFS